MSTNPHQILIVDDDDIFNNLLTDVFRQAGYGVHSATSADEALAIMARQQFDLVVTDQRMPGTPGTQFVRQVMTQYKAVPVVMVSAYLENDTIRELIRDGVGGVFIKPLNIFQLLKRSAQLIERSQAAAAAEAPAGDDDEPHVAREGLRSFPGRSAKAVMFARRLKELRDFSTNLLLSGRRGTDFEAICADLCELSDQREELVTLSAAALAAEALPTRLEGHATRGVKRLTLAIAEPEKLTPEASSTILSIAQHVAPFDTLKVPTRFVFCMTEELDALFDSGRIDENLYLFIGTIELRIPSLGDVRDDLPLMAQAQLDATEEGAWRLDPAAAQWLREHDWPGDMVQFNKVMADAAGAASGRIVGVRELEDAYEGRVVSRKNATDNLRQSLTDARDEYIRAMLDLCNDEKPRTATALGLPKEVLEHILAAGDMA